MILEPHNLCVTKPFCFIDCILFKNRDNSHFLVTAAMLMKKM